MHVCNYFASSRFCSIMLLSVNGHANVWQLQLILFFWRGCEFSRAKKFREHAHASMDWDAQC